MNAYILGLLWGSLSIFSEGFWFRHRDRWYCETVQEALDLSCSIQESISRTGTQYRLKIIRTVDVARITDILDSHGWENRQAETRPYPSGNIDDRAFIRAWCELHSHLDIRQAKRKDGSHYPQKRLRIYGNRELLEEMNEILSTATGLQPRKLQPTSNDVTKTLYYYGSTMQPVIAWLYGGGGLWHPTENLVMKEGEL